MNYLSSVKRLYAEDERKLVFVFMLAFAVVFTLGVVAVELVGLIPALLVLIVILIAGGMVVLTLEKPRR